MPSFRRGCSARRPCLAAGLSLLTIARIAGHPTLPRRDEWRGMALAALFNITAWQAFVAIGTVIQKHRRFSLNAMALAGWQLTLGALPMITMVSLVEPLRWPAASVTAWLAIAHTTFVALVFCYAAWFQMVRLMPVTMASISTLPVPAVGVIGGALMLGEPLGLREVAALLLIGTALALVLVLPARRGGTAVCPGIRARRGVAKSPPPSPWRTRPCRR